MGEFYLIESLALLNNKSPLPWLVTWELFFETILCTPLLIDVSSLSIWGWEGRRRKTPHIVLMRSGVFVNMKQAAAFLDDSSREVSTSNIFVSTALAFSEGRSSFGSNKTEGMCVRGIYFAIFCIGQQKHRPRYAWHYARLHSPGPFETEFIPQEGPHQFALLFCWHVY